MGLANVVRITAIGFFVVVGSMLIARVSNTDMTWHKDVLPSPRTYHQLDLTLDDNTVLKAIEHMNFIQMKTPSAALIITEECTAENNSVTIAWQPPASSYIEGYVLELDDGNGGDFRVVGFSRGVHYWEFTIDRFDADTDPSFGVARLDMSKEEMLGNDESGWSMYIDKQRSWFMHCRSHEQWCEGGIQVGSTVGVLLDLNKHQLSFFINDEPQGHVAFHGLYGVFYPAVSVNRGVAVTLHTALDAPSDIENC